MNKFTYFQLQRKFFDVGESCAAEYFEKTSDCEETESRTTSEALHLKYKNLKTIILIYLYLAMIVNKVSSVVNAHSPINEYDA